MACDKQSTQGCQYAQVPTLCHCLTYILIKGCYDSMLPLLGFTLVLDQFPISLLYIFMCPPFGMETNNLCLPCRCSLEFNFFFFLLLLPPSSSFSFFFLFLLLSPSFSFLFFFSSSLSPSSSSSPSPPHSPCSYNLKENRGPHQ